MRLTLTYLQLKATNPRSSKKTAPPCDFSKGPANNGINKFYT